jgi:preprotein translocase subunit SecD
MSTLRNLLQDGDPLPRDIRVLDGARDRMRMAIVHAAARRVAATPSRRSVASNLLVATVLLTVAAVTFTVWTRIVTPVQAAVRFEVRLAEDHPVPGLLVYQVKGSDRLLYLHPEIVAGNEDVVRTSVVPDGNRFGVSVDFSSSAIERLHQATTAHISRPMAVLLDGEVVLAPTVRAPIGDVAVITGNFSRSEAERIARGIAGP